MNARKNKFLQGLMRLAPLLLPYLQKYLQKPTSHRKVGGGLNSARPQGGKPGKTDLLQKQYFGQNLGSLVVNDAIVAKRFVSRAGFFQTLPVS